MILRLKFLAVLILILGSDKEGVAQNLRFYSFEELPSLQKKEARSVLVFLTAEWCTYCKRIENTSFEEDEIIERLNTEFYFVKLDIEYKGTIELGGRSFKFKPSGLKSGIHELAETIGTIEGVLNTPTFVLLNSKFEIVYRYGGFLDTDQIKMLLLKGS